jgi:hypothetical protein
MFSRLVERTALPPGAGVRTWKPCDRVFGTRGASLRDGSDPARRRRHPRGACDKIMGGDVPYGGISLVNSWAARECGIGPGAQEGRDVPTPGRDSRSSCAPSRSLSVAGPDTTGGDETVATARDCMRRELLCQQEFRQKRGGMMPPLGVVAGGDSTLLETRRRAVTRRRARCAWRQGAQLPAMARHVHDGKRARPMREIDSSRCASPDGSRFVEAMMTMGATLKQQHRHVLPYLTAACEAALSGAPARSLLPTPDVLEPHIRPTA